MKKLFQFSMFAFLFSFVVACSDAPEGKKIEAEAAKEAPEEKVEATMYQLDKENSVINWTGSKPTGKHTGTLNFGGGTVGVLDGKIVSGTFIFDMKTIKNTDLPAEKQGNLENHLMAGDFFEVEKFPAGSFKVTEVKPSTAVEGATHEVTGNLILKGISKSVTVPANVTLNDNMVSVVTPAFTIDRTEWNINFKSTAIGTLKDQAINDEIGLVLQFVAKPQQVQ